jgi:hypothetical protein
MIHSYRDAGCTAFWIVMAAAIVLIWYVVVTTLVTEGAL